MRVAVLGGGITGVCAALELAARGLAVDLYEQDEQLISRASYWNEGKIHLGLVYAQDRSRRSARTMLEGALRFRPLLARWIETGILDRALSDPFLYAVHRRSLTSPPAIEAHFRAVAELYLSLVRQPGAEYVAPIEGWVWRPLDGAAIFSGDEIAACYSTEERSIDPFVIAEGLRSAAAASPNLTVATGTTVRSVARGRGVRLSVVSERGGHVNAETYDAVINALWQNRLGIDATLGLAESRPVLHRFKVGLHSTPSFAPGTLPSVTFVLGPFGDTVNFGHRAYLSWYPAAHVLTSLERAPPSPDRDVLDSDLRHVETGTLKALSRLMPGQQSVLERSSGHWNFGGGYITAWGRTDIDDESSRLHERFEIGVHSTGAYHSIDTGKYTVGPHFAEQACNRVAPRSTVALSTPTRERTRPGESS
jgi:hypothetical protein